MEICCLVKSFAGGTCGFSYREIEEEPLNPLADLDTGVPADLDPPRFGLPGPNPLADMDPPPRIWTPTPLTKLSENIILNVLVKIDDTLRSSAY